MIGGGGSLERTSLHSKFPDMRENTGKILEFGLDSACCAELTAVISVVYGEIPYFM